MDRRLEVVFVVRGHPVLDPGLWGVEPPSSAIGAGNIRSTAEIADKLPKPSDCSAGPTVRRRSPVGQDHFGKLQSAKIPT
jgi:hypothetical protein